MMGCVVALTDEITVRWWCGHTASCLWH